MPLTDLEKRIIRLSQEQPEFRQKFAKEIRKDLQRRRQASIDDDELSWEALHRLADQAPRILQMLRDLGEDLESWQEDNIQIAAEYIDAVHDSLAYRRGP